MIVPFSHRKKPFTHTRPQQVCKHPSTRHCPGYDIHMDVPMCSAQRSRIHVIRKNPGEPGGHGREIGRTLQLCVFCQLGNMLNQFVRFDVFEHIQACARSHGGFFFPLRRIGGEYDELRSIRQP
jgi:hypothetical protein